ncbi:exopolyphosphatase / guanosine-5'-triphosphate,3'-diphosphate pyrophosphatase [Actinopolyspora xinjiangensis]|uniref:Exopolyphosphatase / guanosine-5'-triphosphate,3'-diphosphate pyrophosphatase n=1 Tax=Actinopolyspora xinjiangensis TaxID=405564 RepID=A0A1H0W8Y7_9ACTN|nr:Ppx/GppA phosphatase family protein [Actinopolyspora xinjiangensis]SDP86941.1 exopolyphosphatase / guanosine-5'-triphosphate,3'-diphosphate pyrophosphatase [Actinopolyspora xinjiangensis]
MRLGVLDVGSNTVHLLVVDAHPGAHPTPMTSEKSVLRLSERIGANGSLTDPDVEELVRTVEAARDSARGLGCAELMAFATSAIRQADNAATVLDRVRGRTGVRLEVLSGEQEARLTFLAARRWYGWSAGNLLLLDIGGGSLEMALGIDEQPDLAVSLPLGAGHVARTGLSGDPPGRDEVKRLRNWLSEQLSETVERFAAFGAPDKVAATSKTFRSLARLTGAAPPSAGPRVRRTLTDTALRQLLAFITRISARDLASLDGVSGSRAHQLVSGGLVAEAAMNGMSLRELDICPWALREGVILRRLDHVNGVERPDDGLATPSPTATSDTG